MLTEVASLNGSVIQDLNLENSKTNASSTIAAYAIWDFGVATDGLARSEIDSSKAGLSKFVFINYSNTTAKTFVIPSNLTETSTVATRSLVAPHVNEETDISWAGQTVGDNGDLTGDQTTEYLDCGSSGEDGCVITVPGPGIVLALLDPNASSTAGFYVGNSTIAGLEGYESSGASTSRVSQSGLLWSGVGVGLGLAGWFVEVL